MKIVALHRYNIGCQCLSPPYVSICDVLHNLVPIVQFRKREKHPWRSVTFSKVAG